LEQNPLVLIISVQARKIFLKSVRQLGFLVQSGHVPIVFPPSASRKVRTSILHISDLCAGTKRDINHWLRMANLFSGLQQLLLENNCINALYVEDTCEIECSLLLFTTGITIVVST